MSTIFTKILHGEIPCHKIFENEFVLAFLDIAPLAPGHTLVIPKEPAQRMDQLSEKSASALGEVLPKICRAIQKATGIENYNILQNNGRMANQEVMHMHFHIIPKPDFENGLEIHWKPKKSSENERKEICQKIIDSF